MAGGYDLSPTILVDSPFLVQRIVRTARGSVALDVQSNITCSRNVVSNVTATRALFHVIAHNVDGHVRHVRVTNVGRTARSYVSVVVDHVVDNVRDSRELYSRVSVPNVGK